MYDGCVLPGLLPGCVDHSVSFRLQDGKGEPSGNVPSNTCKNVVVLTFRGKQWRTATEIGTGSASDKNPIFGNKVC